MRVWRLIQDHLLAVVLPPALAVVVAAVAVGGQGDVPAEAVARVAVPSGEMSRALTHLRHPETLRRTIEQMQARGIPFVGPLRDPPRHAQESRTQARARELSRHLFAREIAGDRLEVRLVMGGVDDVYPSRVLQAHLRGTRRPQPRSSGPTILPEENEAQERLKQLQAALQQNQKTRDALLQQNDGLDPLQVLAQTRSRLQDMRLHLSERRAACEATEAALEVIQDASKDLPPYVQPPQKDDGAQAALKKLQDLLARRRSDLREVLLKVTEAHPRAQELSHQVQDLEARLAELQVYEARRQPPPQVNPDYTANRAAASRLKARLTELQSKAAALEAQRKQLAAALPARLEAARQYEALNDHIAAQREAMRQEKARLKTIQTRRLQRAAEAEADQEDGRPSLEVVGLPEARKRQSGGGVAPGLIVLIAAMIGLLSGLLWAGLTERRSGRVRGPEDIQSVLGVPVLAAVGEDEMDEQWMEDPDAPPAPISRLALAVATSLLGLAVLGLTVYGASRLLYSGDRSPSPQQEQWMPLHVSPPDAASSEGHGGTARSPAPPGTRGADPAGDAAAPATSLLLTDKP